MLDNVSSSLLHMRSTVLLAWHSLRERMGGRGEGSESQRTPLTPSLGVTGRRREAVRVWWSLSGLKMKMRGEMQGQLKRQEKS